MTVSMVSNPDAKVPFLKKPLHIGYCVIFGLFFLYTGATTPDHLNWLLENALSLSLVILLASFYNIFRFSDRSYTLILVFLLLHMYGSQYQYADNPLGEWLQETYSLSRNHYDRIVHFSFGLLLAYPMHEVLLRSFHVKKLLSYILPVEFTLSFSTLYELLEWSVADLAFEGSEQGLDYLGAQGDVWDAQKDVALALTGALLAMSVTYILKRRKLKATHSPAKTRE